MAYARFALTWTWSLNEEFWFILDGETCFCARELAQTRKTFRTHHRTKKKSKTRSNLGASFCGKSTLTSWRVRKAWIRRPKTVDGPVTLAVVTPTRLQIPCSATFAGPIGERVSRIYVFSVPKNFTFGIFPWCLQMSPWPSLRTFLH